MRAVNLLPRDEPKRSFEAERGVAFAAGGGAALLTVLFTTMIFSAGGAASEQQRTLDGLNAELALIPSAAPADPNAGVDATLVATKNARIGALSAALAGRVAWDGVLREISQILPEDVWLSTLSSTKSVPAPGAAPGPTRVGVTVSGSTYSQDGVARFLSRLAIVPALSNVQLLTSTTSVVETKSIVGFTIQADVRPPGAAS